MAADITQYLASIKSDIARPSRFEVSIPVPLKLLNYRNMNQQLTLRCEAAQLPSITLATTERKIYGPVEKQPIKSTFNDAMFVFFLSGDMSEKYFFDAWIQLINPQSTYNLNYKSDYAVPVTITQYDVQGKQTYSITLTDAFPISVNQLDLDWSNETMFHKMYVDFAYHDWQQNGIQSIVSQVQGSAISTAVDYVTQSISSGKVFNPFGSNAPGGSTYSMKNISKLF